MSTDEVWTALQKTWVVCQQVFPSDFGSPSLMAHALMDRVVSSEMVFHAYMFTQAMRDHHSSQQTAQKRREALEFYGRTVSAINQNLQSPATACSEDNILAVCNLALHKILDEDEKYPTFAKRPSQGPLNSLQLLNMYGGLVEGAAVHLEGMLRMVQTRGGLSTVMMPGFASSICQYVKFMTSSRTELTRLLQARTYRRKPIRTATTD